MKLLIKNLWMLIVLFSGLTSYSQTKGLKPIAATGQQTNGRTIAVVVGISDYQSPDIPDLQFAHRDAIFFAEYLKDVHGGGLDSNDVTLLINEQATSGKYISALYGVLDEAEEGDNVILYFSGHGDVESTTISQPGFLLCWDAPPRVYMSGGTFGLAYFQEVISTIATKTKAEVIVITDACRAGKLAGSGISGTQATAAHLAKQYANEIKILACQPNELALESESWGGGRGVFSFHFLRGIQGLADRNKDNIVTLSEISRYLEDMVTPAVSPHRQIPLVVGNRQAKIATVHPLSLSRLSANSNHVATLDFIDQRTINLTISDFEDSIRYKTYTAFLQAMEDGHLLHPLEGSAWQLYHEIASYEELHSQLGLMRRNLAAALQDDSQQAINKYVAGDQEEVKRRWNYDQDFWQYPYQLEKASELLGEAHFFYKPLRARYYYFKGLVKRLEAEQSQDTTLYYEAIALQDSSLTILPDGVHAINEKGYTYYSLEQYDNAITQYNLAIELVDTWPLVWTNLCHAHNYLSNKVEARMAAERAMEIDSNFLLSNWAMGIVYEEEGDLQKAIQYFLKVAKMDEELSMAYTRLTRIYTDIKNYDQAYDFGVKALSYDTTDLINLINLAHSCLNIDRFDQAKYYFDQAVAFHPNALMAQQGVIEYYFYSNNLEHAKQELLKYLTHYPKDDFAYYLLSSCYGGQSDIKESLIQLENAFELGFNNFEVLEDDDNLIEVRESRDYQLLLEKFDLKQ